LGGQAKTLLDELARPLITSWWTPVAGVCIGLSAGIIVTEKLPFFVAAPASPEPVQVWLLGVAIGLIVFVGPPLVRTAVNPVICSEPAIRDITEVPLLATIPQIKTPLTAGASRRRVTVNVGLSALCAGALVVVTLLTMA